MNDTPSKKNTERSKNIKYQENSKYLEINIKWNLILFLSNLADLSFFLKKNDIGNWLEGSFPIPPWRSDCHHDMITAAAGLARLRRKVLGIVGGGGGGGGGGTARTAQPT